MRAHDLISQLQLEAHPEGGYFREVYRSSESIPLAGLPGRFGGPRSFGTAIYFLLRPGEVSHLHRIQADELWHFYAGTPLRVHLLDETTGQHRTLELGPDLAAGQSFFGMVPTGTWFGAEVNAPPESDPHDEVFSLVGCTVAPGFDFADFELGTRDDLLARFPAHEEIVKRLT